MYAMGECSIFRNMLSMWDLPRKKVLSQGLNYDFHSKYNNPCDMALKIFRALQGIGRQIF